MLHSIPYQGARVGARGIRDDRTFHGSLTGKAKVKNLELKREPIAPCRFVMPLALPGAERGAPNLRFG